MLKDYASRPLTKYATSYAASRRHHATGKTATPTHNGECVPAIFENVQEGITCTTRNRSISGQATVRSATFRRLVELAIELRAHTR